MDKMRAYVDLDYWLGMAYQEFEFTKDLDHTRQLFSNLIENGLIVYEELPDKKGVAAFMVAKDFRGRQVLQELFMYIAPKYRGNVRLFKQLICIFEKNALKYECELIALTSDIGYNDEMVKKILRRWGYNTEVGLIKRV